LLPPAKPSSPNINCSIEESIQRFAPVVEAARNAGIYVRGAMSCVVGCPYEGEVSPAAVERLAKLMKDIGVQHLACATPSAWAHPQGQGQARHGSIPQNTLMSTTSLATFTDTCGQALANTLASFKMGI
jgi:hydroxymethylglutaryl-CoA lyase